MSAEQNHPDAPAINVLACQIAIPTTPTQEARDQHLQSVASRVVAAAANQSIQLIVLPELSSIDYSRESFDQLETLAETLDGPSARCWGKVARACNAAVCYSFARKGTDGYYICVAVVDRCGKLLGHYDKMHLAQYGASMEKEYFQRGDHLFAFDINGIRLAPIVCYDIRFPELCRRLVTDHNVASILHCGAYYRDESFYTWHDFARTRALENQLYFLSLNRAGKHYGNSLFCPPWIDNTVHATGFSTHDEEFKIVEINMAQVTNTRNEYSFLQDRLSKY